MAMQANQEPRRLTVLTNSEMRCRRRCAREHYYSYRLGYRAIEDAESLRVGTLMHAGLEQWWLGNGLDAALEAVVKGAADEFEAAKVRVLMRGYDARWEAPDSDVIGVELEFRAPLVNPETGAPSRTYQLGGKLDVLKARKFVEHKTTSADIGVGSVYWRALTLDSQISTYFEGAKALGHEVDGCVYDVIRKPALRPSQVPLRDEAGFKIVLDAQGERVYCKTPNKGGPKPRETADAKEGYVLQTRPETVEEFEARLTEEIASNPDKYYQRGEVVRLDAEVREAAADAWQLSRAMREDELAGRHPRNADACQRYGRTCGYFSVCTGVDNLDNPSSFVRLSNVHPELSVESPDAA